VVAASFQTVATDFDLPPYELVLSDDVEAGNQGWTAQAPWAITTEAASSPTHSWTDSPGGAYADNRNVALTSPVFDLSAFAEVRLSFWHLYDLETGFDHGRVEVSADGGASWITVATYTGAATAPWRQVDIALPALDGAAAARVRFRLTSDPGVTRDGWHVDDIELAGVGAGGFALFADGFETGDTSAWSVTVP
jgi:hypothetical protein